MKKKYLAALALAGLLSAVNVTVTAFAEISPSTSTTIVPSGGGGGGGGGSSRGPSGSTITVGSGPGVPMTIEESDVPLGDMIEDEAVPLGGLIPIGNIDTPLGLLPSTGDMGQNPFWLMLFAGSGIGMAAVGLGMRKKHREAEESA